MTKDYEKLIVSFGREIVNYISTELMKSKWETGQKLIPYLDKEKCKIFKLNCHFTNYGLHKGTIHDCVIRRHSHITLEWCAKPKQNSSIIWSSSYSIRTEHLVALIDSLYRNSKIESVLK